MSHQKENGDAPARKLRQTPSRSWEIDRIIALNDAGLNIPQIAGKMRIKHSVVADIVKKNNVEKGRDKIKKEVLRDKVTLLKDIVGQSLEVTKEYLDEMKDPEVRKIRMRTPSDMAQFALVATKLNEMLRVELGESTQNIAVVHYTVEQTRKILSDLKKTDPVFEYPELDEETNGSPE